MRFKPVLKNIGIDLHPIKSNDASRNKSAYIGMKYSIHLNKAVETTKVEERCPNLRNLTHFAIRSASVSNHVCCMYLISGNLNDII